MIFRERKGVPFYKKQTFFARPGERGLAVVRALERIFNFSRGQAFPIFINFIGQALALFFSRALEPNFRARLRVKISFFGAKPAPFRTFASE